MKVRKAIFMWKRIEKDPYFFGKLNRLEVIFQEGEENPTILIDAGKVKIEDNSLKIESKEVLKKIGEIDFEKEYDPKCFNEYSGDSWELQINDKKYEGVLEDPHYVVKVKKIIRYSAIKLYAEKHLAGYLK